MGRTMSDPGGQRGASWGARLLALGALTAAALGVVMVVSGSVGGGDGGGDARDGSNRAQRRIEGCTPSDREALRNGYYVVQPGEPGLSAVADKTCIPVERLMRLNENLDPRLIPQSACINLRR